MRFYGNTRWDNQAAKEQEMASGLRMKEIEEARVQAHKAKVEEMQRKEEGLTAKIESAKGESEKTLGEMKGVLELRGKIEEELLPLERELTRLEDEKKSFMKERQKLQKKLNEDSQGIDRMKDEIINKDNMMSEFLKKIAEVEERLSEQQKVYESVRSDRNLYSKNLIETQDEIAEITKRIKIVAQQIDQLKEELEVKDKIVTHEMSRTKELSKSFQMFERKNDSLRQRKEAREEDIKGLINEIGKLKFMKTTIDKDLVKIQEVYNTMVSERDLLGTELIQKNDEIALLHEKISLHENGLKNGHLELGKVENELKILDIIIKDLSRELLIHKNKVIRLTGYKGKILTLNEMLLEEKLRVKALSEELENPLNANRWRSVGSVELDDFELMGRVQTIQKKLIRVTQDLIASDYQISAHKSTVTSLRELMERNPGAKEAERFMLLQRALRMKTRKIKGLAAELNLFRQKYVESQQKMESLKENIDFNHKKYNETVHKSKMFGNESAFTESN